MPGPDPKHDTLEDEPVLTPNAGREPVVDGDLENERGAEAELEPEVEPEGLDEADSAEEGGFEAPEDASDEPRAARSGTRGRGSNLGKLLLLSGGGAWALALMLRCTGPADETETPTAALAADDSDPEPAPPSPAPTPATGDPAPTPAVDDVPPEAEDEAPVDGPPPGPADVDMLDDSWTKNVKKPTQVRYTIKRGGSMRTVANLYKIYHHEIKELNPGIELDKELPAGSKIVVWKAGDADSQSVGTAGRGSLEHGVPMVEGPGRQLKMTPWKSFATIEAVAMMDALLGRWAEVSPDQPLLIGNMSARDGGRLKPHSSHQSGRDVDVSYPQKWDKKEELNWREMTKRNLDCKKTWLLLKLLAQSGAVKAVFIDRELQKVLYDWAVENKPVPKSQLGRWLQTAGGSSPLVVHVPGHTDHIHIRFKCPPGDNRCEN